jgi:FkbM family methyltransferase
MSMPDEALTDDEVRIAFRFAFGREPRQADIDWHRRHRTFEDLRQAFLQSSEFKAINGFDPHVIGRDIAIELANGLIVWIPLDDLYVSRGIIAGSWEPAETAFINSLLGVGATFLDIGAFVGWFSLHAARLVGPTGCVIAFEPQLDAFELFRRSIAHNRFERIIRSYPLALSDRTGEVALHQDPASSAERNKGHTWISGLNEASDGTKVGQSSAVRLDDIRLPGRIDVVKIDVEGAEWRVLAGGENIIRASHPVVVCELYPSQLSRVSNISAEDFIENVCKWGYAPFVFNGGGRLRPLVEADMPTGYKSYTTIVFR